jgi:hypothetical protein
MENQQNNRTLWIILGIVAVLLCCCALAVALGILGVLSFTPLERFTQFESEPGGLVGQYSASTQRTFDGLGSAPILEIDNFAGAISVRSGASGIVDVTATRRASSRGALDDIDVQWAADSAGVRIETEVRQRIASNRAVHFVVEVPPDARLEIYTGAGEVIVEGVRGEIEINTGAGEIRVSGAMAAARLETGAGSIDYEGDPRDDVRLETGAGSIVIRLPAGADADLDLSTGIGSVNVAGFDVDGTVSAREVEGTIGLGGISVRAETGTGSIDLVPSGR